MRARILLIGSRYMEPVKKRFFLICALEKSTRVHIVRVKKHSGQSDKKNIRRERASSDADLISLSLFDLHDDQEIEQFASSLIWPFSISASEIFRYFNIS